MIFKQADLMPRPGRYRILAGPGSPYSHKVRAALRYRGIPHDWTIPLGGFDGTGQSEGLKAFGKRLLPVVVYPDGTPWNDSTPILHEMERLHPEGPSLMPPTPAQRFLARLVEDFADEWLAVILMAFRWTSEADVAFCARRQMAGWLGDVDEPTLSVGIEKFTARQQMVRNFIGGGDPTTHAALEAEYLTLLDILERGLSRRLFLFGQRPSIADFGLYGMLSQLAIDPTPARLMRAQAVRTYQWTHWVDDLSGHRGAWFDDPAPDDTLIELVALAGGGFRAMMQASGEAAARGELRCAFEVGGATLASVARPYTVDCWLWLKAMFEELPEVDRKALRPILEPAGFWDVLAFGPGERDRLKPFATI
jgi:glutathione S-transferase